VLHAGDFVHHSSGRSYPQTLHWQWRTPEDAVDLVLRRPQVIEAASLLGFLPGWQQRLARLFANPYYFRFSADLELTVDLNGVHAVENGAALYELMILR
jgi:hypothetical protein